LDPAQVDEGERIARGSRPDTGNESADQPLIWILLTLRGVSEGRDVIVMLR